MRSRARTRDAKIPKRDLELERDIKKNPGMRFIARVRYDLKVMFVINLVIYYIVFTVSVCARIVSVDRN